MPKNKIVKIIIIVLSTIIFALFFFKIGLIIGNKISCRWDNPNFSNRNQQIKMFFGDIQPREYGGIGEIISISDSSLIISSSDNTEQVIRLSENTKIRRGQEEINLEDDGLKISEKIAVVGKPNENYEIEAILIRVIPDNFPPRPNDKFLGNEFRENQKVSSSTTKFYKQTNNNQ
jgi:hypothetical protein